MDRRDPPTCFEGERTHMRAGRSQRYIENTHGLIIVYKRFLNARQDKNRFDRVRLIANTPGRTSPQDRLPNGYNHKRVFRFGAWIFNISQRYIQQRQTNIDRKRSEEINSPTNQIITPRSENQSSPQTESVSIPPPCKFLFLFFSLRARKASTPSMPIRSALSRGFPASSRDSTAESANRPREIAFERKSIHWHNVDACDDEWWWDGRA